MKITSTKQWRHMVADEKIRVGMWIGRNDGIYEITALEEHELPITCREVIFDKDDLNKHHLGEEFDLTILDAIGIEIL